MKCKICGKEGVLVTQTHHISYKPEKTIEVCKGCHWRIHFQKGFHNELKPSKEQKEILEKLKENTSAGSTGLIIPFNDN